MRNGGAALVLAASIILGGGLAMAQGLPGFGGSSNNGGGAASPLGQMIGNQAGALVDRALPDVSGLALPNTTGLLGYCLKNQLLKQSGASSLLGQLSGRNDVQSSNGFRLGEQGRIETANGAVYSLEGLKDSLKSKMCDMVFDHAKSLM